MNRYRFLTSGRWVGLMLTALIVVVTCILLGMWQWGRYEHKRDLVAQFDRAYNAPTIPLADVVAEGVSIDGTREWRPVELTGQWTGEQILIRNRAVGGKNAYRVVAVLQTPGINVVVDRGWLPVEETAPTPPPLPSGQVSFVGRLRPPEPADSRGITQGQAHAINPNQLGQGALLNGYVQVTDGLDGLRGYPTPERDLGPHLSYAFQWWVFALGAVVGLVILARREAAENAGRIAPRPKRASLEREEDALLDSQL
ncbi:hypothetical protein BSZ39_02105 [Bowdeniella nasicola]|uniref:SURF1-like protein n=1 Tax=Bowdeniella nasicola TaxID=208480 RepID=A0A1Q5Q4P0_9ACTO|nr:SURF1 family protein [Bowdeniella nasicola]OKL54794.1 hypothetical protein BSZ39_02105 [Bowdeniella nasicola]